MKTLVASAHRTVETYVSPQRFVSPHQYLVALTARLDDQCMLIGERPPNVPAAFTNRQVQLFALPEVPTELGLLLERVGMGQTELSARSGVARETINHIVRGRVDRTHTSVAVSLAWGLDVPLAALAGLIDEFPLGPRSGIGVYS